MSSSTPDGFTAAVLTVSDSSSRGERADVSGPAVVESLEKNKFQVVATQIIPDDRTHIENALIQLADRNEDAALVSATAALLHPDSGVQVNEQPFIRTLMHRSLESGLFRLMAEAMEDGPLGSIPLGLFADEEDEDSFF